MNFMIGCKNICSDFAYANTLSKVDASRPWSRFINKTTTMDKDSASGSGDAVFERGVTELGEFVKIFLLLKGNDF